MSTLMLYEMIKEGRRWQCEKLRARYSSVLSLSEEGRSGRARIARVYGKTFEQLTFSDIIYDTK